MDLRYALIALLAGCPSPVASVASQALSAGPACFDPSAYPGASDRERGQAAIDAACSAGGGTVCWSPGTYTFDRAPLGSYNRFAALSLHCSGVTLRGTDATLELAGDQGGSTTILISVDPSAEHIRVTDLTLRLSATNTDEQTHAIATTGVCSGATCQPIRDVEIDHIRFQWGRVAPDWRTGDCIRLLGSSPATELYGVRIHNVTGTTGRAFVEVQRGVHQVKIEDNFMYCDACDQLIDGEATGVTGTVGQPTDISVAGNGFDRGAAAQGDHVISMTSAARVTIAGNTMYHGGITLYRTIGASVTGNTIESPTTQGDEGVIQVANACDGLVISGNTVKRGGHVGPVVKLVPHSGVLCGNANIGPNTLTQGTAFQAIYAESLSSTSIHDNTIVYPPPGANGFPAIEVRAIYSGDRAVHALSVSENVISGAVTYAVDLHASPGTYGRGVLVSGNTADNTTFGLRCDGPGFTAPVVSNGNAMGPSAYGSATVEHGD